MNMTRRHYLYLGKFQHLSTIYYNYNLQVLVLGLISLYLFLPPKKLSIPTRAPRHASIADSEMHSEKSSWWMLVRPDEDSQVRDTADVWRVDATDVKLDDSLVRTSSGWLQFFFKSSQWRTRGTQRWLHASFSIAGALILNGAFSSWKVGLTKCFSFLLTRFPSLH